MRSLCMLVTVESDCYMRSLRSDGTRSTAQDPRGEEVLTTRDLSCLDFAERRSSPRSSLRQNESGGEEVLTQHGRPGARTSPDFAERRSSPRSSVRQDESGGEEALTPTRTTRPGLAKGKRSSMDVLYARDRRVGLLYVSGV